jgi:hypothetical protein
MAIVGLVSGERSLGERRSQGSTSVAALAQQPAEAVMGGIRAVDTAPDGAGAA